MKKKKKEIFKIIVEPWNVHVISSVYLIRNVSTLNQFLYKSQIVAAY